MNEHFKAGFEKAASSRMAKETLKKLKTFLKKNGPGSSGWSIPSKATPKSISKLDRRGSGRVVPYSDRGNLLPRDAQDMYVQNIKDVRKAYPK